jgi:hypothetical protein
MPLPSSVNITPQQIQLEYEVSGLVASSRTQGTPEEVVAILAYK